jgi:hypothetical protein
VAWKGWRALVDFDEVDGPELRLLPLAHANLRERIHDDPVEGRVRGIVRMTWTRNQLLFRRAAPVVEALGVAGVDTLILKGAPLALLHYGSVAERPMADVDLLVRPAQAADAMRVLRDKEWAPSREPAEAVIRAHHSHDFHDDGPGQIDLHWFSLWQSGDDEPLWQAARTAELGGVATLAPDPADLLLIVCVHGAPREPEPAIRWVADAAALIRGGEIDWGRLEAEAVRRELTVTVAATLSYLSREFDLPIPEPAIRRLSQAPTPRWERLAFRAQVGPPGPLRTATLVAERHHRLRRLSHIAPWHPGFVEFAGSVWGFERRRDLVRHGLRRVGRRGDGDGA